MCACRTASVASRSILKIVPCQITFFSEFQARIQEGCVCRTASVASGSILKIFFAMPNYIFPHFQARIHEGCVSAVQNGERSERKHFEDLALPNHIFPQFHARIHEGCVHTIEYGERIASQRILKVLLS